LKEFENIKVPTPTSAESMQLSEEAKVKRNAAKRLAINRALGIGTLYTAGEIAKATGASKPCASQAIGEVQAHFAIQQRRKGRGCRQTAQGMLYSSPPIKESF